MSGGGFLGDFYESDDDLFYDATSTIEEYPNGKTWDCHCGHGIGTPKETHKVKCRSCGTYLIDEDWEGRERINDAVDSEHVLGQDDQFLREYKHDTEGEDNEESDTDDGEITLEDFA